MKKINLIILSMVFCVQISAKEARISLLRPKMAKKLEEIKETKKDKSNLYLKLIRSNEEIKRLLARKSSEPVIWDGTKSILTGKVFKGTLLNSIVSTNLASPVLVKAHTNQGLPERTLFSCSGSTKHRRVRVVCKKMITKNKEVGVHAQILNVDGSAGLLGLYDDGKEDLITGSIVSEVAQGVLSVAQDKVVTPFGSYAESNLKNQVLGGLIRGGRATSDILLEEMKTKEPIVTINAGEEVLIYFMEALNEY